MAAVRAPHRASVWCALLLVIAIALVVVPAPSAQAADNTVLEADVVALVNIERARHGLPRLQVRDELRDVAQQHSLRMAEQGRLHHNPAFSREIRNWGVVAENVGVGPSVSAIHRALMNSEGHRANILNQRVTEIGIGVTIANGRVWITQNFRLPRGGSSDGILSTTVFGDVLGTSVHRDHVLAVAARGIADACGLARFCPDDPVTRQDFVVMLARALEVAPASSSRFTDMDGDAARYAEALAQRGIVRGTSATTFHPRRALTRQQFASLLARALQYPPEPTSFADVDPAHIGNVGALEARGLVTGCGLHRFCAADRVTRAQAAAMIDRRFS